MSRCFEMKLIRFTSKNINLPTVLKQRFHNGTQVRIIKIISLRMEYADTFSHSYIFCASIQAFQGKGVSKAGRRHSPQVR